MLCWSIYFICLCLVMTGLALLVVDSIYTIIYSNVYTGNLFCSPPAIPTTTTAAIPLLELLNPFSQTSIARQVYTVPKVIGFPRYKMKCSGENEILRGMFPVVSRFPLYFMLYRGNWITFRTVYVAFHIATPMRQVY